MESLEMGEQLFANRDYPVYFIQIFGTALTYFTLMYQSQLNERRNWNDSEMSGLVSLNNST